MFVPFEVVNFLIIAHPDGRSYNPTTDFQRIYLCRYL